MPRRLAVQAHKATGETLICLAKDLISFADYIGIRPIVEEIELCSPGQGFREHQYPLPLTNLQQRHVFNISNPIVNTARTDQVNP